MKSILYRAKAINRNPNRTYRTDYQNGDWVYGLVSKLYKYDDKYFAEMTNTDGVSGIDVDPETICEYTGLTDKNGNKIFEGDIVFYTDIFDEGGKGEKYIVGIGECMALDDLSGYGVYIQEQEGDKMLLNADELTLSRLEIIGNIYDRPELLEK